MKQFKAKIKIVDDDEYGGFEKFKTCDYKDLLQRVIRFGIESGLPKEYIIANGFDYPKELFDDAKPKSKYSSLSIGATISLNGQNYAVVDHEKFPLSQKLITDNGEVYVYPLGEYLESIGKSNYIRLFSDDEYLKCLEFYEQNREKLYITKTVEANRLFLSLSSDYFNDLIEINTVFPQEEKAVFIIIINRYKNAIKFTDRKEAVK